MFKLLWTKITKIMEFKLKELKTLLIPNSPHKEKFDKYQIHLSN